MSEEERFWSKVNIGKPDECWEWQALRTEHGYGRAYVGEGRVQRAHRVSWELTHGPIPEGLCVLHRCDNRLCVNPEHLFLGTQADNMRDKQEKGRAPHGENHCRAKLTENDVREIRELAGVTPQHVLAERFGVCKATVCYVQTGHSWRHLL